MATYILPSEYVIHVKDATYRYLRNFYGLRHEAISRILKDGAISRQTYENLLPYLRDSGVKPLAWEDIVATSAINMGDARGEELFQRIRGLYMQGKGELAIAAGRKGLNHRHADVWFYSGWALLIVANRIGSAQDFVDVVAQLHRRMERPAKIPPQDLRACACDVAKWLLENNAYQPAYEFYKPLMEYFRPRIEKMPAQVGASLLRGYGTLNLLKTYHSQAQSLYKQALELSGNNLEAKVGTLCWQCMEQIKDPNWHPPQNPWDQLESLIGSNLLKAAPVGISAQTYVSARLLLCLSPKLEEKSAAFEESVEDCARWIQRNHAGVQKFIVPGTPLGNLASKVESNHTRHLLRPLIRAGISQADKQTAIQFLGRISLNTSGLS